MVINGGSCRKWRRFAPHLANEKDNERVRLVEVRGMNAKTIKEGFTQLQAMADMAGAGDKEFYYHANINPKKDEVLTEQQWEEAGDRLHKNLKLDGQPGMIIEHVKDGRRHRHYIDLRVDLDTGKLISDGWNYVKHEKTARALEREFQLEKVKGALVERDGPRPQRRPKNWEVQRGKRTGIEVDDVGAKVTALWNGCQNGAQVRTEFARNGYELCQGNRGANFCIVDAAGKEYSLARRVAGAREKDIRRKMRDIDRNRLPTVDEARAQRRDDKRCVQAAVTRGADKANVERAINAGRAAEVTGKPKTEAAESEGQQEAYARTFAGRRAMKDAPAPQKNAARWQEREGSRIQRGQDAELER